MNRNFRPTTSNDRRQEPSYKSNALIDGIDLIDKCLRFRPVSRSVCFSVSIYRARLLTFVQTVFAIIHYRSLFFILRADDRVYLFFQFDAHSARHRPRYLIQYRNDSRRAFVCGERQCFFFFRFFPLSRGRYFFFLLLLYFFPIIMQTLYTARHVIVIYLRRSAPSNVCGHLVHGKIYSRFSPNPPIPCHTFVVANAPPTLCIRTYGWGRTCDCTLCNAIRISTIHVVRYRQINSYCCVCDSVVKLFNRSYVLAVV